MKTVYRPQFEPDLVPKNAETWKMQRIEEGNVLHLHAFVLLRVDLPFQN